MYPVHQITIWRDDKIFASERKNKIIKNYQKNYTLESFVLSSYWRSFFVLSNFCKT